MVTSYLRSQPTRILYPTEIFRLQSSSIKNISMNGDFRYTIANMNLPNYYDSYQGLNGTTRSLTYTATRSAKREVAAADYGIVWQAMKNVQLADQVDFSNVHQPGTTTMTSVTTIATPATAGNETINYSGPLTTTTIAAAGASTFEGSGAVGTPSPGYFGQNFLTNNLTGTWDASARTTLSLTYRYARTPSHRAAPHNTPLAVGATSKRNRDHQRKRRNLQRRPASHHQLGYQWLGRGALRRQRIYPGRSRGKPSTTECIPCTGPSPGRRSPAPATTWNGITTPTTTRLPSRPAMTRTKGPLNHVDHSRVVSLGAVLAAERALWVRSQLRL